MYVFAYMFLHVYESASYLNSILGFNSVDYELNFDLDFEQTILNSRTGSCWIYANFDLLVWYVGIDYMKCKDQLINSVDCDMRTLNFLVWESG